MGFVQIIEYTSSREDELKAALDEYLAATDGRRATTRALRCADRDRPNTYFSIVEFPSYEAAMRNSELPETAALAAKMGELCDGPPTFHNLDVIDSFEG